MVGVLAGVLTRNGSIVGVTGVTPTINYLLCGRKLLTDKLLANKDATGFLLVKPQLPVVHPGRPLSSLLNLDLL
jgi:hypothetical protein